ncbi:NADH-quinone oxidoreductase subunit C [Variovorax soli]|uniref:Ni,Fe-hydrogenase III large subunit/Ni,Fe-hydrogenase III component G n=1 Tax=Variovorax soli TaxID=376815 RepID=A0ABU1ND11_9BURK|nr:NADH-quinone oxidoreductase subunit C [Variovorax soli]MDR6536324.1 Ni,Fe-hydrogenase III large subunit/Ni,Fe-hydrogenase III component G [Variovorax soli]
MTRPELGTDLRRLPAPLPAWHARVSRDAWGTAARSIAHAGGRLVSVWGVDRSASGDGMAACAAYAVSEGLVWVELKLDDAAQGFPDLAVAFPCAERMQRAVADLSGIRAEGSRDDRPWLNHGVWPPGSSPLQHAPQPDATAAAGALPANYPFVRVDGDGVHEIAVGPVHAGIIEPGHFRFSVVGEKVLRLEQHLGYTHKGIERRFTELMPLEGHRLAGRISGDTTVAYAWAYSMALETAWNCEIPPRAAWLRALMLERERVANHLGDLGALGNDAALAFGLAQFSRLREDWLRLSKEIFGHRLMMDAIVPGGVATDLTPPMRARLSTQCDAIEREVRALRRIYDEHAGLQDRFVGTGRVMPQLAAQLGLTGLAGRASAQMADLRCDFPWPPYDRLKATIVTHSDGDVAARVAVRFEETFESLRLIRAICSGLPDGAAHVELRPQASASLGAGWVEGWRGEVLVALEIDGDDRIVRCHCHDPSWQNWPVLEHAIIGNIVPDFPLINKSFNLSYSGHDL